jgi:replicative DNA helicase
MSAGLQLLRAVIDTQARDTFRLLGDRLFTEDELPAWRFVSDYFTRYGVIPTVDACRENGLFLPEAVGPVAYFRDMVRNRMIYNTYSGALPLLSEMLQRGDYEGFVALLSQTTQAMQTTLAVRDTYTAQQAIQMVMEDLAETRVFGSFRGVTYGWPTLDELTGGARPGDLATVVARPGLGKTFTILRMATSAWSAGHPVLFVSNEMSVLEIARRLLSIGSGVGADFIQRATLSAWAYEAIQFALDRLPHMPPFHLLIGDLTKSVRDVDALIGETDPSVVYVDASYLMRPVNYKSGQRRFETAADTARDMKGLANRTQKPIIQTVQFNRAQKEDEGPSLDHIGQTDEVGQLSSLVVGVRKGSSPNETRQRRYVVIKNRHGQDGITFTTRFEHTPFNMDEIDNNQGDDSEMDDYDGTQNPPPMRTEWTG